jgi:hypothetical protein
MKLAVAVTSLLLVAEGARGADPVYLDQLVETPLAALQQQFPNLKSEGCYALEEHRFLQISIDKKDQKPWRVTLTADAPCRKPDVGPAMDVRVRSGILLGDSTISVVSRLGRPDASAPPSGDQRRLGEIEYFYICRVSEGCARHTSVFVKQGVVSAVSEWYSEN